jgi:hypothetical protein
MLGSIYLHLQDYQSSLEAYEHQLEASQKIGGYSEKSNALGNLAT